MKKITVFLASLLFISTIAMAQSGRGNNWLSFVIQSESRAGGSAPWAKMQRLEVSKKVGAQTRKENATGLIRFEPQDKEVRFTFSNFTLNGAWFSPMEIAVEYVEGGRPIGPIRAMPGGGAGDYFQLSLRFREKTERSVLSIWATGRASGQFVKDTIHTVLTWGSGGGPENADVQVSYLDTYETAARGGLTSYNADQGRISTGAEGTYTIELGAYSVIPDGRQFSAAAAFGDVYSRRIGGLYHIRVGRYNGLSLAQQNLQRLRSNYPEAFVVVEDNAPAPPAGGAVYSTPYEPPLTSYGAETGRIGGTGTVAPKGTAGAIHEIPAGATGYAIQLASYTDEANALSFAESLRARGISDVYIWKKDGRKRVVIASFPDKGSAAGYLATLKRQYLQDGIVVYIRD